MSRRRIPMRIAISIASERMALLSILSLKSLRKNEEEMARRYVFLIRRISQKMNIPISKEFLFCKGCNIPLIIGNNCRVRLNTGKTKITCIKCNNIRRIPY